MRSSTCRRTPAPRSSTPDGATPTPACTRSTSWTSVAAARPTRSAPAMFPTAPTTCCPTRRASTTTTRDGSSSPPPTRSAGSRRAGCASTGTAPASRSPSAWASSTRPGATVVFEVAIDDYAEVWLDGALPVALGDTGGQVVGGFNAYAPQRAQVAWPVVFELERHAAGLDQVAGDGARVEQVAGDFEFTEGPVWSPDGALLFSSPNTNAIYRWDPRGEVTVFRSKSGYTGHRHRALSPARLQRPDLRPRRAPGHVPARQSPRPARRAARQRHRDGRPLLVAAMTLTSP